MIEDSAASGLGLMVLLAASTLVSEDLTTIGAGVLAADGRISLAGAVIACFAGILVGDLLLFLAGRIFGWRLLTLPLARRVVSPEALDRGAAWLEKYGAAAVLVSRLVPGTRLPTYVAAGALGTDARTFAVWFTVAAALWTPLLVGVSSTLGATFARSTLVAGQGLAAVALATLAVMWMLLSAGRLVLSRRNRRVVYGLWKRTVRWEFWPPWIFYPPVLACIVFLMIRHRGVTVFTAANPGIPGGGFIGESKFSILRALSPSGVVARAALIPGDLPASRRIGIATRVMTALGLTFPVVVKPDQGQRGSGVVVVRTGDELAAHLSRSPIDLIVQEYVPGLEFGVFYYRRPGQQRGRILSITEKRFPIVTGDGRRTLEELVLDDARAVCLVRAYRRLHRERWHDVPASGERLQLVEVGSHCRGSIFADATPLVTPELESAFDDISSHFDGFYFGRFDVRTPSVEAFRSGTDLRVLELNGVTSEATHIYDAANSVLDAWRVLFVQWRLAFEIGAENRRRGFAPATFASLLTLVRDYRQTARLHPQALG
ncbi:MAG TPA: VTT domain-containing protein [Vicinamibacterales bacterium]|nr:VTT domain-containing protein [Vicinamibacterales bacterium]